MRKIIKEESLKDMWITLNIIFTAILLDEATKERGSQFWVNNNNTEKIFYVNIWSHTNTGLVCSCFVLCQKKFRRKKHIILFCFLLLLRPWFLFLILMSNQAIFSLAFSVERKAPPLAFCVRSAQILSSPVVVEMLKELSRSQSSKETMSALLSNC